MSGAVIHFPARLHGIYWDNFTLFLCKRHWECVQILVHAVHMARKYLFHSRCHQNPCSRACTVATHKWGCHINIDLSP